MVHSGNIDRALKELSKKGSRRFRGYLSALTLALFMWNELEANEESFQAFLSTLEESPEGSAGYKLRHTDLALNPIKEYVLAPRRVTFDEDEDGNIKDDIKVVLSKSTLHDRICKKIQQFRCHTDNWELLVRLIDPTPIDVSSALKDDGPFIGSSRCYTLRDVLLQWQIIQRLPKAIELLKELM